MSKINVAKSERMKTNFTETRQELFETYQKEIAGPIRLEPI